MYGGAKWRSGADTCVFNPAVRCDGEDGVEAGVVSRIVNQGTTDERVEALIRETFPELVADGSVTVHTRVCAPNFVAEDLVPASGYKPKPGCGKLEAQGLLTVGAKPTLANLLTPIRRVGPMARILNSPVVNLTNAQKVEMIRPALNAAITMVPDAGPWIIHADCHLGNVLLDGDPPRASLSDWGRVVVVRAPITPESVRDGLQTYVQTSMRYALEQFVRLIPPGRTQAMTKRDWIDDPALGEAAWNAKVASLTADEKTAAIALLTPNDWKDVLLAIGDRFPQHPQHILSELGTFFPTRTTRVRPNLRAVRGWVPYVLLNQLFTPTYNDNVDIARFDEVLATNTQAELRAAVERVLATVAAAAPAVPPAFTFAPPPPAPGVAVARPPDGIPPPPPGIAFARPPDRAPIYVPVPPPRYVPAGPPARANAALPPEAYVPSERRPAVEVVELPPAGGMYWPRKYHRGLSTRKNRERKRDATRRTKMSWKNPRAYTPWKTDTGVKTRRSSYTSRFRKMCPGATTIPQISRCTKVPRKTLRTVYNRGMAAWRTGHRPGASQHAWGMARVHSFVTHGKTYQTADADLARKTSRGKK